MICRYCGSELPAEALFCGECGRAVLAESLVGASVGGPVEASAGAPVGASVGGPAEPAELVEQATEDHARFAPPPDASEVGEAPNGLRCPQCDSPVDETDVFCGECGFVLRAVVPGPRDTAVVEPAWPFDEAPAVPEAPADEAPADDVPADDVPDDDVPEPPEPESHRKDPIMPDTDDEPQEAAPAGARSRTIPDPFPWGADLDDDEDLEATRLVPAGGGGDRFVLQFSTGESVTVSGAGLIGRNPAAQPGEYVDQLVSIFDVGKSVSKTHLEFGQEGGRFWVSDRYSTNGSVVRQPEAEPRRCEPGRRYFVVRGTRIDLGEQFFVVS
jgi:hypothetical protein